MMGEIMDKNVLLQEQTKLKTVQGVIAKEIENLDKLIKFNESKIKDSLTYAASEKLDVYEIADIYGEVYARDVSIDSLKKDRKMFARILPKPFFAKIIVKQGQGEPETFYIGLKNLHRGDEQYIIDWRTPIASLLYFSSLGKTCYDAPMGKINVELLLKRQFRLEPNKIVSYIDTNTKIDDDILQEILSKNTSAHMTNIVESIQEEQNAIIRKPANLSVVINGVAGSGKTSIAMHRISYILYVNNGDIKSENVLIISPSKIFSSYIGDLLPELGEDDVPTSSMPQILTKVGLNPKKFGGKLAMVESQNYDEDRKKEIEIKFSVNFFDKTNQFLKTYDIATPVCEAFKNAGLALPVSAFQKFSNFKTDEIKQNIEQLIDNVLYSNYPHCKEKILQKAKQKILKCLGKLLTVEEVMESLYAKHNLHIAEQPYGFEDAPIYAYINSRLKGVEKNYFVKHIFVDEMQDYDAFSIALLRQIYPSATMTLTGDYNQNILSSQSNFAMLKRILPKATVDNLLISYRSTNEIFDFAQKIVGQHASTRFVRNGDKPEIKHCKTDEEFATFVDSVVKKHPNEKIAIITKTLTEANKIAKFLNNFVFIKNEEDDALLFASNILTTTYLSKGLEYDRIIIPNADCENYNTPLDRQNLYVACTRALHGIYVCYKNNLTKFIKQETKKQF